MHRRLLASLLDWRLVVGGELVFGFVLLSVFPQFVSHYDPLAIGAGAPLSPASGTHWFGTDELGRDLFARVAYGARVTLVVSGSSLATSAVIGTALGTVAAYYGRYADEIAMRSLDILMAFPGVLLAIAIVAGLGPNLLNLSVAMAVYSIPVFARLCRGMVLSIIEEEYVMTARSLGASDARIVLRHVLPNIYSGIAVQIAVRFGLIVLSAAALGFLGLGVQPPEPEWGQLINSGRPYLNSNPGLTLFPGLTLMITVLAFNLLAEGLQEFLNPRLRQ